MNYKSYNLLKIGDCHVTLFSSKTGDSIQFMLQPYWLNIGYSFLFQWGFHNLPETKDNPGITALYLGFIKISLLKCST